MNYVFSDIFSYQAAQENNLIIKAINNFLVLCTRRDSILTFFCTYQIFGATICYCNQENFYVDQTYVPWSNDIIGIMSEYA